MPSATLLRRTAKAETGLIVLLWPAAVRPGMPSLGGVSRTPTDSQLSAELKARHEAGALAASKAASYKNRAGFPRSELVGSA